MNPNHGPGHDHSGHVHTHGPDHRAVVHGDHAAHRHLPGQLDLNAAFALGLLLNAVFVVVEAVFGFTSNSLALLADAGHNLGDVFGLGLAWLAVWLSRRPPTSRRTYGFGRSTILASFLNAIVLLIAVGAIGFEAVQRFSSPAPINGLTVAVVAAVGILVNGGTAWLLLGRSGHDLNVRAAYMHMAADAAASLAVVVAGGLLILTGWAWIDPLMSLILSAVIAFATFRLLKESFDLAMDAVPRAIDRFKVEKFLLSNEGVSSVHDLHIWPLSTTSVALTAHLVMPDAGADDHFLHRVCGALHEHFGIDHATLQIERGDGETPCRLAPESMI